MAKTRRAKILWLLVLVYLTAPVVRAISGGCRVVVYVETLNRRVWGPVTAECGWFHPGPWGNWGVDSAYGSRTNGDQFAGWKYLDDHWQWNSCTTEWPPPNCDNYNYQNCENQTTDIGDTSYGVGFSEYLGGQSCADLQGYVYDVYSHQAQLYELDPVFPPDDYVSYILFPT